VFGPFLEEEEGGFDDDDADAAAAGEKNRLLLDIYIELLPRKKNRVS